MGYFALIAVLNIVLAEWVARIPPLDSRRMLLPVVRVWWVASLALARSDFFFHPWATSIGFRIAPLLVGSLTAVLLLMLAVSRAWRRTVETSSLPQMVRVHLLRVPYGLTLIALANAELLPWSFALPAGLGDIASGIGAVFVAGLVDRASPTTRWIALAWNALALLDFVNVVRLAYRDIPGFSTAHLTPIYIGALPGFAVPILITLHLYLFYRLTAAKA